MSLNQQIAIALTERPELRSLADVSSPGGAAQMLGGGQDVGVVASYVPSTGSEQDASCWPSTSHRE